MSNAPQAVRVRHEVKRRRLTVARVEQWAPQMKRIVLTGDELRDFRSLGFDDHVKLFFDDATMRDFTPRRFDAKSGELWIDFFLHDAGPATNWAAHAAVGQTLDVGGPRGSMILPPESIGSHVFIGDETAIPAIGRRLEELPAGTRALLVLECDAGSTWPALASAAELQVIRVARNGRSGSPAHELIDALGRLEFPADSFFWVATESHAARAIRRHLRDERGIDKDWIKAAGYWQRGASGEHQLIGNDD